MLMRPPVSLLLVIKVDVSIQFGLRCPAATRCVEGRKAAVADLNQVALQGQPARGERQIPQPVYTTLRRVAHTLKTYEPAARGPGCRLPSVRLKVCLAYCRVLGSLE